MAQRTNEINKNNNLVQQIKKGNINEVNNFINNVSIYIKIVLI